MLHKVIWASQAQTGLEHFYLQGGEEGIVADGVVIGVEEGEAFRIRYQVHCGLNWRVRRVVIQSLEEDEHTLRFVSDGQGRWTDRSGLHVPALDGCVDVDITATPFTNTLPIRRLGLVPGASAEIRVLYCILPQMYVRAEPQRYTCLEAGSDGGTYRFESLSDGFTAEIRVDADGLVEDYPGLFTRVWKHADPNRPA